MANKHIDNDTPLAAIKNGSTRARWEMFHQAIALAKESNSAELQDGETTAQESVRSGPHLSIVR